MKKKKQEQEAAYINLDKDPENQDWLHRVEKSDKRIERKKSSRQKSGSSGDKPAERK